MNRALVWLPLLVACNGYQGQFLLTVPTMTTTATTEEVTEENFVGAQPIQDDPTDPTPTEWTSTDETTYSPTLYVVEITNVEGGDALLVMGNTVFPGTVDGGVYTFTWTNFEESNETNTHTSGYHVGRVESDSVTNTIHFDPHERTGDLTFEQSNELSLFESDEFDYASIGASDLYEVRYYLETTDGGYVSNDSDTVECSDADCKLTIVSTVSSTGAFTAQEVAHDGFTGASQGAP